MKEEEALVKLHYFDLLFTPLKENVNIDNSESILSKCINHINRYRLEEETAIVFNRHEGRIDELPRNLFVSSISYAYKEKIYRGTIALIRDNKIPILVDKENYSFTSLNDLKGKAIAEATHFYIKMVGNTPIFLCEYNYNGPRISDIEYYFRSISSFKMLCISKACKASIHMDMPVNDVLASLKDVFRFKFKARTNRLSFLNSEINDPFIGNMIALANTVDPKEIKIDAYFREREKSKKKKTLGGKIVGVSKRILNAISENSDLIDDFEDFYLEFEKEDGSVDGVFNLIKGKHEILIYCPYKTPGNIDSKMLYELAKKEFNSYIIQKNEVS